MKKEKSLIEKLRGQDNQIIESSKYNYTTAIIFLGFVFLITVLLMQRIDISGNCDVNIEGSLKLIGVERNLSQLEWNDNQLTGYSFLTSKANIPDFESGELNKIEVSNCRFRVSIPSYLSGMLR